MMNRRHILQSISLSALASFGNTPLYAQAAVELELLAAGAGSAFLPYGEALARIINPGGIVTLKVLQTKGSIENLSSVETDSNRVGMAFIGSAFEAINGIGPFDGRKHTNIRAIAPMYETSFQTAAKQDRRIQKVSDLAGRKVGVGPAGGPAEAFFKGLMEVTGVNAVLVNGTSAELEAAYLADQIDALWQGASIPIPVLAKLANTVESVVFGLEGQELEAMLKRFPYLALGDVAANTYKGQTRPLRSVAAWNVIVAHAGLDTEKAYRLTRAILSVDELAQMTNGAGASTVPANASKNRVVPWHPGAIRFMAEKGIVL